MNEDRVPTNYKLIRLVRTQSSEVYLIWDDDRRIGQIDLHYAHDTIHGTSDPGGGSCPVDQEEGPHRPDRR